MRGGNQGKPRCFPAVVQVGQPKTGGFIHPVWKEEIVMVRNRSFVLSAAGCLVCAALMIDPLSVSAGEPVNVSTAVYRTAAGGGTAAKQVQYYRGPVGYGYGGGYYQPYYGGYGSGYGYAPAYPPAYPGYPVYTNSVFATPTYYIQPPQFYQAPYAYPYGGGYGYGYSGVVVGRGAW